MSTPTDKQFADVLKIVMAWPSDQRRMLADRLMESSQPSSTCTTTPRKGSLKDLLGLIKTDGPPPNDEECDKIREEALMEKYGK